MSGMLIDAEAQDLADAVPAASAAPQSLKEVRAEIVDDGAKLAEIPFVQAEPPQPASEPAAAQPEAPKRKPAKKPEAASATPPASGEAGAVGGRLQF